MNQIKKIFKNKNRPIVIGAVHCAPLSGYKNFPGTEAVEEKFMHDFRVLLDGGVDAIIIENNYDTPHYEVAKKSTIPQLTDLCIKARKLTKKPLGTCVLWNDYETALSIAKTAGLNFVRIPVFVDKVKTSYGIFSAKARECIRFRKSIDAENVLIFADIQVKHAKHLIKRSISGAVKEAVKNKADVLIVTGGWTGDPPDEKDVINVKKTSGKTPVILGSGITPDNLNKYNVDGFIVGSYFKGEGNGKEKDYHNIFPWKAKIKKNRVKKFMNSLNKPL